MNDAKPHESAGLPVLVLRALALLGAVAASGVAVVRLAAPALLVPLGAGPARPDLAAVVTAGCALALALCWVALAGSVLRATSHALLAAAGRTRPAGPPPDRSARPLRWAATVLVGAVLGTGTIGGAGATGSGYAAGPAPACSGTALPTEGLLLPDLPATDVVVRVRPGDSLWAVAARHLQPEAPAAAVDRAWRQLYRANTRVVGPDPDLVHPGTVLRVPPALLDRRDRP